MQNKLVLDKNFEQLLLEYDPPIELPRERPRSPASVALELGELSMRFARIDRIPRYEDHERENDVEHSFMLGMVATELAYMFQPELDVRLVGEYARVHDLIEVATGDVATFNLTPEELATKEAAEQKALQDLLEKLPPYSASLLKQYEKQEDIESRFVRAVDKLMPLIVDIVGQGKRVMYEDYGVNTYEDARSSHKVLHERIARKFGEFALVVTAHRQLCDLFVESFAQPQTDVVDITP